MSEPRLPGWYQDPFGTRPEDQRYWDGETWLAAKPEQAWEQPTPAGEPHRPHQQVQHEWDSAPATGWQHDATTAAAGDRATTPDGVPLAGWGRRFGAYVVDWILLGILTLVVAGVLGLLGSTAEFFSDYTASGSTDPAAAQSAVDDFILANSGSFLILSIVTLVASALYHVGLVATRGRTLGKQLLGIRVRMREQEGVPGLAPALMRWLVHFGLPNMLTGLPVLGGLAAVFPILDGLWPLWDARRQAIHDKVAKTSVVVG